MVPKSILDTWQNFEIETSVSQFQKLTSTSLEKSGNDFAKLLRNLYTYFEPFFQIQNERLMDYKIKITNRIFMDLPNRYREALLTIKGGKGVSYTDEEQFEKTLWKLASQSREHTIPLERI